MIVRPAVPADLDAVYLLGYDAWSGGASREEYLAACRSSEKYARGSWRALEADGVPVSALIVYALADGVFGLGSIATEASRRRRGFAERLIGSVVAELESGGARAIFLHSDVAPAYYRKFGFVPLPDGAQRKTGSVCMIKSAEPWTAFVVPDYF